MLGLARRHGRDSGRGPARRHRGGGVAALAEVGALLGFELTFRLAARCAHIPLGDGESEQHVIQHEEHQTHHDEQWDVLGRRGGAVEQQVHQPGREREAEVDVEGVGDRQRQPGEDRVDDIKRERHEHEGELQRFGDTGQKRRQPGRREDAERQLLLPRVGDVDHRQRGGGQTEHQDRVEACSQMSAGGITRGEPRQFARDDRPVGLGVAAVEEPDVGVQDVVQPNGNQHPVGEAVGEGSQRTGPADELAQAGQSGVEERIEVAHRERDHQNGQRHDDRHKSPPTEETEVRRQLDGVVPVEQPGGEESDDDAAQHAVVDLRLITGLVQDPVQHDRRHGLEHRLHHQVADDRRQCGGPVGLAGEPDGHTHGEQQGEVVEQCATGRAHGLEERADHRGLDPAQQVILAQAQQDARRREHSDRQHEALAEPLQLRETGDVQSRFSLCA